MYLYYLTFLMLVVFSNHCVASLNMRTIHFEFTENERFEWNTPEECLLNFNTTHILSMVKSAKTCDAAVDCAGYNVTTSSPYVILPSDIDGDSCMKCLLCWTLPVMGHCDSFSGSVHKLIVDPDFYMTFDDVDGSTVLATPINGEIEGGAIATQGKKGNSIHLGGSNQYINLGNQSDKCLGNLQLCPNGYTMSFWLKLGARPPYSGTNNLALGKSAVQSTDYQSNPTTFGAHKATDGLFENCLAVGTFTSSYTYEPWWNVDLGAFYDVSHVVIRRRSGCSPCDNRLQDVNIGVSGTPPSGTLDPDSYDLCYHIAVAPLDGSVTTYNCQPGPILGRYVILQTVGRTSLMEMCEVEVYPYAGVRYVMSSGGHGISAYMLQGNLTIEFLKPTKQWSVLMELNELVWYHVMATWREDSGLRVLLDGALQASVTTYDDRNITTMSNDFLLGATMDNGHNVMFNAECWLDELAVFYWTLHDSLAAQLMLG